MSIKPTRESRGMSRTALGREGRGRRGDCAGAQEWAKVEGVTGIGPWSAGLLAAAALAAPQPFRADAGEDFFERRIRPLLAEQCAQCHNGQLLSAGIDMRRPETLLGTAVIAGDESSPLIRAVRYESAVKMPPTGRLPQEKIRLLVDWVRMGAPWPGHGTAGGEDDGLSEETVHSDHWAFQPLRDPEPPDIGSSRWPRNGIDRFVLARLRSAGLEPAPAAAPLTLLRRARYGLTGLPPLPDEVERFGEPGAPTGFGQLVDALLATPQYGERWARHWLDVARFADSTGVDEDHPFGNSWRYRDYVVQAFSEDLPFDRFIREQVAGDLLPPAAGEPVNARGIVATGFLAVGPMALAQRDPVQKRYDVVDEQIDTLTKAFLGLTVACARCHDHKFDPILTSDYYALAGIFASTRTFEDWRKNGSRYLKQPLVEAAEYEAYSQHASKVDRLQRVVRMARQAAVMRYLLNGPGTRIAEMMLAAAQPERPFGPDAKTVAWLRTYLTPRPVPRPHLAVWREIGADRAPAAEQYQSELLEVLEGRAAAIASWVRRASAALDASDGADLPELPVELPTSPLFRDLAEEGGPLSADFEDARPLLARPDLAVADDLEARLARLRERAPAEPPMANSVAEGDVVRQRIFRRGQHRSPLAAVERRFPLVLAGNGQPEIREGSGRRELADWIVSKSNPLTARVIVNRVWQWHFGEGIVRTPNNFGTRGEEPTHPLLLDWLASRFVESGWSIKALQRLILESATYRMGSGLSDLAHRLDPDNALLSRFPRRRMSIEELRDSYLHVSARLDSAVGGDTDLGSGNLPEFERNNRRIDPDEHRRRTLYLPLMRNKLPALLRLFDFGDATTSAGTRSSTNVAPQALYLLNSGFAAVSAAGVAGRLAGPSRDRAEMAYRLILGRPPSREETSRAERYVRLRGGGAQGWSSLCKLLLASNEFHHIE